MQYVTIKQFGGGSIFPFETKGLPEPAMQTYLRVFVQFDWASTIFGTLKRLGKKREKKRPRKWTVIETE